MTDILIGIVTSGPVLLALVTGLLGTLIVGYFPLLKWFPVVGQYVAAARLASMILLVLLAFLIGFRISDDRADAKNLKLQLAAKSIDLTAANDAANKADAARAELAQQAESARERIADYEESLKARADGGCALTDDDIRWLYGKRDRR